MSFHRHDIDGLRGVAIVGVVLYHAWPGLLPGGFTGVDVFFVVSGFLITGLIWPEIATGRFSLSDFMTRRARRIVPAMVAMCGVVGILAMLILLPNDLIAFTDSLLAGLAFVANIHFYAETGYFAGPAAEAPLLHLWTLSVEAQFYLLAPIALIVLVRLRIRGIWIVVLAFCVASFALSEWATRTMPEAAFYMLPTRAWELGLGMVLALRPVPRLAPRWANGVSLVGLLLICAGYIALSHTSRFPGAAALAPTLGTVALIVAGPGSWVGQMLGSRVPSWLGRVSYGFYLWHWPLLVLATYVNIQPLGDGAKVFVLLLSLGLAWVSWTLLEAPGRRLRTRRPVRWVLASVGASAAVGVAVLMSNGQPFGGDAVQSRLAELTARPDPVTFGPCARKEAHGATICQLGATDALPRFVVWGDSHALSAAPAFHKAAMDLGIGGLIMSRIACPPLPGLKRADRADGETCAAFNADVLASLPDSVEMIVLAARWPVYLSGEQDPRNAHRSPRFGDATQAEHPVLIRKVLANAMSKFDDLEWVFLEAVPEANGHVLSRVARALRFGRDPGLEVPWAQEQIRRQSATRLLSGVANLHGATLIDPADVFCDERACRFFEKTTVLFRDRHHLSLAGANKLAPLVAPVLRRLLPVDQASVMPWRAAKSD